MGVLVAAAVRALDCLLGYAAAQSVPAPHCLTTPWSWSRAGEKALATAIGVLSPPWHRHAGTFTAAHLQLYTLTPARPSSAAAWLRQGGYDPLLLTALGPGPLLEAVPEQLPGADCHLAHVPSTGPGTP